MEEVVELADSHDSSLAAVVGNAKDIEDINEVLFFVSGFLVLDELHLLEQSVDVSNETSACWALDVWIHCEAIRLRIAVGILMIYRINFKVGDLKLKLNIDLHKYNHRISN